MTEVKGPPLLKNKGWYWTQQVDGDPKGVWRQLMELMV